MHDTFSQASYLDAVLTSKPMQFDWIEELDWEDSVTTISLEEAGLEEGSESETVHGQYHSNEGSIYSYTAWFYEDDSFSVI